jgi:hypothetical protein
MRFSVELPLNTVRGAVLSLGIFAAGALASGCTVDTYCPKCENDAQVVVDAGPDTGVDKVVATGGGGSVRHCSVGGGLASGSGAGSLMGLLPVGVAAAFALRVSRRRRG